jgi:hypothetical protein
MSSESGNFLPKVARKWQKCGNDLPLKKVIDSNSRYFRKKKYFFGRSWPKYFTSRKLVAVARKDQVK